MECSNLCFYSEQSCLYCQKNYDVSSDFYKAKRPANGQYVIGYLVKNKSSEIEGILNKAHHFCELAWIDENTLEKIYIEEMERLQS